jgi:hypothetical protein
MSPTCAVCGVRCAVCGVCVCVCVCVCACVRACWCLVTLQVFGEMMCAFSASFETAYNSVGRNLTLMPPAADGMTISESHQAQADFVSVGLHSPRSLESSLDALTPILHLCVSCRVSR